MFRGDTFCLDNGQVWHPAPMEVVIPGCFHGILMGGTSQLEELVIYQAESFVLSLLLLAVGLPPLVQLQEEKGRPLLHWGTSIGLSCLCCPHICPQLDQSLQLLQKCFPGTHWPSDRFTGTVNQVLTCSVTRLVSMCESSCEQLCSAFHWGALGIV